MTIRIGTQPPAERTPPPVRARYSPRMPFVTTGTALAR